jgi:NADH-quinone oxidoreductase subunit H
MNPNDVLDLVTSIPTWAILAVIIHFVVLGTVAYLILLERKVASWAQDRIGPNRVGLDFGLPFLPKFHFWGLGQPLADGVKFIMKEDYRPAGVDKVLFTIAPIIMIVVIIPSIATIPWGGWHQRTTTVTVPGEAPVTGPGLLTAIDEALPAPAVVVDYKPNRSSVQQPGDFSRQYFVTYKYPFQIANLNIGVLFIVALLSLAVYGVVIGGWASNNKYSFLGGLRATANMISYEIPLALSIVVIVVMFGTLDLSVIVEKQTHMWLGFIPAWNVFTQPLAFLLFLICIHAEANRAPFDLAEAEQELVGGYHTEYSAMRFALFFLAEYAGMITTSLVLVALFFGGWHLPGVEPVLAKLLGAWRADNVTVTDSLLLCIIRSVIFFTKAIAVLFVFMWVRWSLPRFRFDQLMNIAWKGLIPIGLILSIGTIFCVWLTGGKTFNQVTGDQALIFLAMNGVALVLMFALYKLLPADVNYNEKAKVEGSRYRETPLPGRPVVRPAHAQYAAGDSGPAGALANAR